MAPNDRKPSPEREPDERLDRDDDDDAGEDTTRRAAADDDDAGEDDDDKGGKAAPADNEDEDEDDEEIEAQARKLGWVSEREWRGKAGGWVPARLFLERGRHNRAMFREREKKREAEVAEQLDELKKTNEELARRLDDTGQTLGNIWNRFVSADETAYKRGWNDYERQKLKAVEDADTEAYAEADKKQKALKPPESKPVEIKKTVQRDPVIEEWAQDNPWFDEDLELAMVAQAIDTRLQKEHPSWEKRYRFDQVAKEVRRRYPDRMHNDADERRRGETTTSSTRRGGGNGHDREEGKKGRRFSDLPPEAQEACKRFERDIPGFSRKEYLETYDWS